MTQPDGITPDTKDWTWVLQRPCPECGYAAATMDPLAVGGAVRATLPRWEQALARPGTTTRPAPGVWSALEYGAHVRDVFRVFDTRLAAMLTQDDPLFANWDQDAAALEGGYAHQDPAVVAIELTAAGMAIAARFDAIVPEQLSRTGRRSDGANFTIESFARYLLHDVLHHLHDVSA
ncbi:MAG: DinB family protein [Propionicimonas sp.]|uniref:DinB family protein n=1 Tax=Propionicimonas sp. TaxID=1955623 RepID=UPI002B1FC847|nr:DinB family protein [Propionicimonas sp.]MEA4945063.1 DinB family protein [Propionicimonas sp.]MEA5055159.1 DinB family protein [Propionicimonas sp.]MEA5118666.1 DinB family protein [Propionicimonas sp.]